MRTEVDTNVLSLFWSRGHPLASRISAELAHVQADGALVVSAPVFVELSAFPIATPERVRAALAEMNVEIDFYLGEDVWQLSATTFAAYAIRRRRSGGGVPKRLLPDFVIAAHAMLNADRLMTRDAKRYRQDFPGLRLI